MLASHAALCLLTGSLAMLVFHTLSAGNIGHFGAPGTGVVSTGAIALTGAIAALTGAIAALTGARCPDAGAGLAAAAPHPATEMASAVPAATRRSRSSAKYPVSIGTVASSHTRTPPRDEKGVMTPIIFPSVWASAAR